MHLLAAIMMYLIRIAVSEGQSAADCIEKKVKQQTVVYYRSMERDFEGKVVIVTGSSSGIGEALAIQFARRGAKVTLTGRCEERLQAAFEKCKEQGGGGEDKFMYVTGDVTDPKVREQIIDGTIEKFQRLDVLVCNHGIGLSRPSPLEWTEADADISFKTNTIAPFFLIQKAIPHLEKTKGNVLSVSSVASQVYFSSMMVYGMSKAALDYMTKALALNLGPRGIRLNTINPTQVKTPMVEQAIKTTPILKRLGEAHPLGSRASTLEEQVEVALFLASDKAGFVTGQNLLVDGGIALAGFDDWRPADK